jgi:hypothetical protein
VESQEGDRRWVRNEPPEETSSGLHFVRDAPRVTHRLRCTLGGETRGGRVSPLLGSDALISGRRTLRRSRWAHRASSIIEQEETVMKIEYRCHDHGVVAQGETDDLAAKRPHRDLPGTVCRWIGVWGTAVRGIDPRVITQPQCASRLSVGVRPGVVRSMCARGSSARCRHHRRGCFRCRTARRSQATPGRTVRVFAVVSARLREVQRTTSE